MLRILVAFILFSFARDVLAATEPDTNHTQTSSQSGISWDELEALSRAVGEAFFSDWIPGTSYFVAHRFADSTALVTAHLTPVAFDTNLVAGSRIAVAVSVLDSTNTLLPGFREWNTVLGSGELPMAFEWVLLSSKWFGAYMIHTHENLAKGLRAKPLSPNDTIFLTVRSRGGELEVGPNGVYETARSALKLRDTDPAESARLMDSFSGRWDPSDVMRAFHADALGRAGRCTDQLAQARVFAARGLADSAFVENCSEGYCYYYRENWESVANWANGNANRPPASGDCVQSLWRLAIQSVVNNQQSFGSEKARSFMKQQEARLNEFREDPRFADIHNLVAQWLSENK